MTCTAAIDHIPHYFKALDQVPKHKPDHLRGDTGAQFDPHWLDQTAGKITVATWCALNDTAGTRGKTTIPLAALTNKVAALLGKNTRMHTVKRCIKRLQFLGVLRIAHSYTFPKGQPRQHTIYGVVGEELPRIGGWRRPMIQWTYRAKEILLMSRNPVMITSDEAPGRPPEDLRTYCAREHIETPYVARELLPKEDRRGGKRAGAGRKSKVTLYGNQKSPIIEKNVAQIVPQEIKSDAPLSEDYICSLSSLREEQNSARARVEFFDSKPDPEPIPTTSAPLQANVSAPLNQVLPPSQTTLAAAPKVYPDTPFSIPSLSEELRPGLRLPRIPAPPMLDPALPELARVQKLVSTFEAIYRQQTGRPCYTVPKGLMFGKHRHYGKVVAAAQAMIDRKLAPVTWCKWRFDQWSSLGNDKTPPFDWVYAVGGMLKFHGWFHAETSASCGSHILPMTAKYRALATKHLLVDRARTWREAHELWDRCFPGDSFEQAVAEVSVENRAMQAKINAQVEAGAYLW